MKFLFITNYYPPHHIGGYELHCRRLADWLADEGHRVRILTSTHRNDGEAQRQVDAGNPEVCRELTLRYWTDVTDWGYWRREWRDIHILRRHALDFGPDIIVMWNMVKLASGIILESQRLCSVAAYHLMDEWVSEFRQSNGLPQFWSRPAGSFLGKCLKPVLRAGYRFFFTQDLSKWEPRNAVFVSEALKELTHNAGVAFDKEIVSYITCDTKIFHPPAEKPNESRHEPGASLVRTQSSQPVRFLWAGRLCEGKGLFTTLNALDILHSERGGDWTVDFCGPIEPDDLEERFQPRLEASPWGDRVRYLGAIGYDQMPQAYREHDIFLFSSEVHEGLPGTLVEAFASGLPVIGTLTGGTRDILRPDENCLVFEPGNAEELAQCMHRLLDDSAMRNRLSEHVAEFAQGYCSNERVFPRLVDFYKQLLKATG